MCDVKLAINLSTDHSLGLITSVLDAVKHSPDDWDFVIIVSDWEAQS